MGSAPFKAIVTATGVPTGRAMRALGGPFRRRLQALLVAKATRVANRARAMIPVDAGVAREAIVARPTRGGGAIVELLPGPVKAHAPNGMYYPAVIEYGAEGRPPLAPMRRALEAEAVIAPAGDWARSSLAAPPPSSQAVG